MHTEDLTKLLRQDIRVGALVPGQALVQEDLAKRFNVSRIPVRDALLSLAAEGIVSSRPGGGLAVKRLTADEVEELYDLRIAVEPSLGPRIVDCASPRALADWRRMAIELRRTPPASREWLELNYRFHLSMYEVTGRDHTVRVIRSLLNLTYPYSRLFMESLPESARAQDDHDEMLDAIEARDGSRLRLGMTSHLESAQIAVASFLRSEQGGSRGDSAN